MNISIDKDYAPGFFETVAAAVVSSDDVKLRRLIAVTLREAGVAVKEMSSAAGPLCGERVRCQLFVLDSGMSASGSVIETLRVLRSGERGGDCALMLLSDNDLVEAYNAGVDMVLSKPISMAMFMARVRSVMRRYGIII